MSDLHLGNLRFMIRPATPRSRIGFFVAFILQLLLDSL
jgi:hypothetical protein